MRFAFFGSSLVSAYWNGAATYWRGIIKALHRRGHEIIFYEPDIYDRQAHRDIQPPDYARVVVYQAENDHQVREVVASAAAADVVIKCSGVGAYDDLLVEEVLTLQSFTCTVIYWDVDAPATLDELDASKNDTLAKALPRYDAVFTYGGGTPVVQAYLRHGARLCVPIYNAVDTHIHHPAEPDPRFAADLAFMGNRLPDREARVDAFFFAAAAAVPEKRFLLGGSGWQDKPAVGQLSNVQYVGHVYTRDHNAFCCSPMAVLNISRDSMAHYGFSPATRVFEAAGAGACLITDDWPGIDQFFTPDQEILVVKDGQELAQLIRQLTPQRAQSIGLAARKRVLRDHTYEQRACDVEDALAQLPRFTTTANAGVTQS